ncbi:TerB family tellurite resistance protein [Streptomyces candidus]|uniref:TerB family tellurite resistance protein n=1 Tax=Streptomyces candidus TaxID=67283 RepID=UPI001610A0C0
MLPVRGRSSSPWGSVWRGAWGVRTTWTVVGDGEFFCPGCGGDRNYSRRTGRRRLTVLGVPLVARGLVGPSVQCASCAREFGTETLDHPTTVRFSAMLRDAVHTVALAVLAAGGTSCRTVTGTAAATVRSAGFEDCTEDQLTLLMQALTSDRGCHPADAAEPAAAGARGEGEPDFPYSASLAIELHEALGPLAPHLAVEGRESLLLQGARIALADGPYSPAEREVLTMVGAALKLCPQDTDRLLAAAARTPS